MPEIDPEVRTRIDQTLWAIGSAKRWPGASEVSAGGGSGSSPLTSDTAASEMRRQLDEARDSVYLEEYGGSRYWDFVARVGRMLGRYAASAVYCEEAAVGNPSGFLASLAKHHRNTVAQLGAILDVLNPVLDGTTTSEDLSAIPLPSPLQALPRPRPATKWS